MKTLRIIAVVCSLAFSFAMSAVNLEGKRIYVNPGHGSFGSNDRPMATISYPMLPTTGKPDTCGFYESNTNLQKGLELGRRLTAAGAYVKYSHTQCGPWPYVYPYSDFSDAAYNALPDRNAYNRNLSEICEEVDANNMDYFISIHSNASSADGTYINYPLIVYRGTTGDAYVENSDVMAQTLWSYIFEMMASGLDPATQYSLTEQCVMGDISWYGGQYSTRYSETTGNYYKGYLGVLKHGCPGYLCEGYFHTYQPARHRALNYDYCHAEGVRYYHGITAYFGADEETVGHIAGTVKNQYAPLVHQLYAYVRGTNDAFEPLNGAEVVLYKGGEEVARYTTDGNYNGFFYFPDLEPGDDYSLDITCEGYHPLADEYKTPITVVANKTTYPMVFLKKILNQEIEVMSVWERSDQEESMLPELAALTKDDTKGGMIATAEGVFVQNATTGKMLRFSLRDGSYEGMVESVAGAYAVEKDDAGNVVFFIKKDSGVQPVVFDLAEGKIIREFDTYETDIACEYPNVSGNLLSGKASIWVVPNSKKELRQLVFENGQYQRTETYELSKQNRNFNYVTPINNDTVIVNVRTQGLFLYDVINKQETSFISGSNISTACGGTYFKYGEGRFFAQAHKSTTYSKGAFKVFNISEIDNINEIFYRQWDLGRGTNLSGSCAKFDYVPLQDSIYLVEYVAGIGLVCYRIYDEKVHVTAVDNVSGTDGMQPRVAGGVIMVDADQPTTVEVWTPDGRLVRRVRGNACTLTIDVAPGIYLVGINSHVSKVAVP